MVFVNYLLWHYSTAPGQIVILLKDFSIATWHKFLILQHLRTLFAPWHRFSSKELFGAKSFGDKVGNWIFDIFTRFLAALIRLSVITMGLAVQVAVVIFFIVLFAVWAFWPVVVVAFIGRGVSLIFT